MENPAVIIEEKLLSFRSTHILYYYAKSKVWTKIAARFPVSLPEKHQCTTANWFLHSERFNWSKIPFTLPNTPQSGLPSSRARPLLLAQRQTAIDAHSGRRLVHFRVSRHCLGTGVGMQVLTYVLSIEIALTVTVFCREASRERGSEQWRTGERKQGCRTSVTQAGSTIRQARGWVASISADCGGHGQPRGFVICQEENDGVIECNY